MAFKDMNIKPAYESSLDDIVDDFYEPLLSKSLQYDRIAGFFSSSTLAVVARGMASFISNGGKMRLITSPILNVQDKEAIIKFNSNPDDFKLSDFDFNLDNIQTSFESNHVKALGWLLNQGLLEIKFAIVLEDGHILDTDETESRGLFHQKVGILRDSEGNMISFSGSINETAAAWINNEEEFKVFKSWDQTAEYFRNDLEKFDQIWNGKRKNIKVFDIPSAVKKDLISYSKDFDIQSISIKRYKEEKKKKLNKDGTLISLFPYQSEALQKWRENGHNLLFEMATGTGKTRTAIAGMSSLLSHCTDCLCIISCPQGTLLRQWKDEVEKLKIKVDTSLIADSTNGNWRKDLTQCLLKIKIHYYNKCIIYTTHNTSSSEDFINKIEQYKCTDNILFIADEAHWLGAKTYRRALLDIYKYRIGLSATPSRWYDDKGTALLKDYFGNDTFEFSIQDALSTINPITGKYFLVNYYYNISTVTLTEEESLEYKELTSKISSLYSKLSNEPELETVYDRLIERRANIIKNAENKLEALKDILERLKKENALSDLLIFVSPYQMQSVINILVDKGIIFHKLTQEEGDTPRTEYDGLTERQYIIQKFVNKEYNALIAIKCLDEGIDIPTAKRGILLASSTNPREYIQRIGRIIRQAPHKDFAYLYDICVSSVDDLNEEDIQIENKIKEKEKIRLKEIAFNAINKMNAISIIQNL